MGVSALCVSLALPAYAEDAAAADALFQDAKALMQAHNVAEACPKFEASYKLEKKLGTLLNWSDCLEQSGKIAGAFAHFSEAADWAEKDHDTRASYAEQRRDALRPRLPRILLDVKLGHEKLGVLVNGQPIPESTYGVGMAVDPGPVTVSVVRGDAELERRPAVLQEGEQTTVALDLDAIATAHPLAQPSTVRRGQLVGGLVVGSIGVAGLIAFAGLEGAAFAKKSDANGPGLCKTDSTGMAICTPKGFAIESSAGDLAEAGQWVGVGSAVVTAVGITLIATASRGSARTAPKTGWVVVPILPLGQRAFGVSIGGRL